MMFDAVDPMSTAAIVGTVWAVGGARLMYLRGRRVGRTESPASSVAVARHDPAHASPVAPSYATSTSACRLVFELGTDVAGAARDVDLVDAPHLLIAGMTGSGKSTLVSSLLVDLLEVHSPSELRLVLIDPKRVELAPFRSAPHVLSYTYEPVEALGQLVWLCAEMERRYAALASAGARKIEDVTGMPRIVVVVEELANLMLSRQRRRVEELVVRLASMARAVGIHLVLVTQRPSVDVVTGLIKANVPGRIALTTASAVDSRVILDHGGAEALAGRGDLLAEVAGAHGAHLQGRQVTDAEIAAVVRRAW